ncbi:MAG: EipB family protein [Alphaproteobacteria bacterium]
MAFIPQRAVSFAAMLRKMAFGVYLLAMPLALLSAPLHAEEAEHSVVFLPHKALYRVSLASSRSLNQLASVDGQMLFEWGSSCDGWTTDQKFTLNYLYADGQEMKLRSNYSAWESKAGDAYNFTVRRYRNGTLAEEFRGNAHKGKKGTSFAQYTKPEEKKIPLPDDAYFPVAHTKALLSLHNNDAPFFSAMLFDGSDGEPASEVNAAVGPFKPLEELPLDNELLKTPARKVRMAFYPSVNGTRIAQDEESSPDYEITLMLHQNGVVSSLRIDYGDYSLDGKLEALDVVAEPHC